MIMITIYISNDIATVESDSMRTKIFAMKESH